MSAGNNAALLQLARQAEENSAFYASWLRGWNGTQSDLLARLPLLSRSDLQQRLPQLVSVCAESSSWRCHESTGTTGEPVRLLVDRSRMEADNATVGRHVDRVLGHQDWRERPWVQLVLHPDAGSGAGASPHGKGVLQRWNLARLWCHPDETFVALLATLSGSVVATLPSIAELICRRIQRFRLYSPNIAPSLVVFSGEMVFPEVVNLVENVLGCSTTSIYATTECGVTATACISTDEYHVETENVYFEIVDGEIVCTPLKNHATYILRYRTGDRASWIEGPCVCGREEPRFRLVEGRRPGRLHARGGQTPDLLRFQKLLCGLNVVKINLETTEDHVTHVRYRAEAPLAADARAVLEAVVRAAYGPSHQLRYAYEKVSVAGTRTLRRLVRFDSRSYRGDIEPLERWLTKRMHKRGDILAAAIIGSALDKEAATRFSDCDLIIIVDDPEERHWMHFVRSLRKHVLGISVSLERGRDLNERAPLLCARIHSEARELHGCIRGLVERPTLVAIEREAQAWAQMTAFMLWDVISDPFKFEEEVVLAQRSAKAAINALRYHLLLDGFVDTSSSRVMARARSLYDWPWMDGIARSWVRARELAPPCLTGSPEHEEMTYAALFCVRHLQSRVCPPSSGTSLPARRPSALGAEPSAINAS